jgi:hypothetical protein
MSTLAIDRYHAGVTIAASTQAISGDGPDLADASVRSSIEAAVLELLAEAAPGARKAA